MAHEIVSYQLARFSRVTFCVVVVFFLSHALDQSLDN